MRIACGLVVLVFLAAGCLGGGGTPCSTGGGGGLVELRSVRHAFDGVASATLGKATSQEFAFEVEEGAEGVLATLEWDGTAQLTLQLVSPTNETTTGTRDAPGRLFAATTSKPEPGDWVARVGAISAQNASYHLVAIVEEERPKANVVNGTASLAGRGLAEVNMQMAAGETISYCLDAPAEAAWNVHTHSGSGTAHDFLEGTGSADGSFTAPDTGTYSFAVRSEKGEVVNVSYAVRGSFRLISHVR